MKRLVSFFGVLSLVLAFSAPSFAQSKKVRVAAASDVKFALDSIVAVFAGRSSHNVAVTYGSSGKLFEQISNGAPFDIFFSADISYPEKLNAKGLTATPPEQYGTGRLVIWSLMTEAATKKMAGLLNEGVRHVAIANPQHAPYGERAVEAMLYYNIYANVKPKLVYGENISQAAQYLYSGAAEAGIIALSLALSPPMQKLKGSYYLIPEESHKPLHQAYAIVRGSDKNVAVREFHLFLKSERVKEIFKFYGFVVP
jgi:molybdate transport system substrate-binding protein